MDKGQKFNEKLQEIHLLARDITLIEFCFQNSVGDVGGLVKEWISTAREYPALFGKQLAFNFLSSV